MKRIAFPVLVLPVTKQSSFITLIQLKWMYRTVSKAVLVQMAPRQAKENMLIRKKTKLFKNRPLQSLID